MDATLDRIAAIRAAFPPEGLFADKDWLISPEPFVIDAKLAEQLNKLGHRLNLFNRACNELYQRSVSGKQPPWIADYLDRGKPPELVEFSRRKQFRADLPRVIRPDLVLTEEGFTIAELDTVPGGIGLTAWLNTTYASFGTHDLLGGANGMVAGFRTLVGDRADILVSKEAATYRPEMEYLAREMRSAEGGVRNDGDTFRVCEAESYIPNSEFPTPHSLYRFFEHFDLPNIPTAPAIMQAVADGRAQITPPFKPYLEEKMWFALFWLRPLREFWRRELSEQHFLELQKVIPYTWILDPQALPQHAVIPGLEIQSFEELKHFSQKQRELILKISGFHETAWGSRSVVLGSDASQHEWETALTEALTEFSAHPYILQRFHKGRLVDQRFLNASGQIETMRGRVRLCPYYFVIDGKAALRGALATVCPPDKKLLHGMKDAIMVPTAVMP
ncbi:hypothetical protein CfE428DRAFT_4568 [Chthoniobacter flavus Ellin428]|uniref:Uncharacterized protein n=1 Tax=Chthoniobacter flavus Ellin428 TaxID=497964 RepID=B4D6M8_9BACT|nr:hypothetical protein [Chthoniobacter flavus]EDY17829.1 hypothetical protein CfE428DRAFT_4568 [Chthoniobacter flavus Ellin428]TCO88441.1 hypothetical protein EV701_11743 [Chthoniobacter flavus]